MELGLAFTGALGYLAGIVVMVPAGLVVGACLGRLRSMVG